MNRLWVRLTVAFSLVTLTGIMAAALLANYQVSAQFRRFVAHNQLMGSVEPRLAGYYARHGSWAGVESVFAALRGPGMAGPGPGRGMPRGALPLILADTSGRVVYAGAGSKPPLQLSPQTLADAIPVEWQNQTVGYLVVSPPGRAELAGPARAFLDQTNRWLLQAGLVAGGLGILLGLVIARGLSAPLGRLATAARRISQGELDQRVPVKGANEIADLAQAFNEMAANLQQAESLRRNLVADIAHELRTPLSVIQGNLQAILDDVYPLEKAEIAAIYDETLILNRLINDLRELAQAEAGQLSLNLQATGLGPLVTGAVDLLAEFARDQKITLEVELPARLPPALVDPDRTRQVLNNLLTNALRHTPPGGEVRVLVEPRPALGANMEPNGAGPAACIWVAITDTGPGISAQDLPHVFDRFWRADRSRSREQGGSGLGLAIAKQLVEAQGGQIGVESAGLPGRGSRFWFTVPIARDRPPV